MRKTTRPVARGFTLVEILVVVVILGIASAIIVPQIGTNNDLKAAAAARLVIADLIYAQNRAIAMQQMHYVKFDLGTTKSYKVLTKFTSPETIVTHPVNKGDYIVTFGANGMPGLKDCTLDSTTAFDSQTTVAFDELGQPYSVNSTGTATIMTAGQVKVTCGTYSLTITIEPYTGELTVQ